MALVRMRQSNPMANFGFSTELFDEFDRLVNGARAAVNSDLGSSAFPVDLYETDEAFVLEMVVPGLEPDALDLSIEGQQLTIKGKLEDTDEDSRRYWLKNIPRGDINRSLKLPASIDADNVQATVNNGLLKLIVPKRAEAKVKKIAINN